MMKYEAKFPPSFTAASDITWNMLCFFVEGAKDTNHKFFSEVNHRHHFLRTEHGCRYNKNMKQGREDIYSTQ